MHEHRAQTNRQSNYKAQTCLEARTSEWRSSASLTHGTARCRAFCRDGLMQRALAVNGAVQKHRHSPPPKFNLPNTFIGSAAQQRRRIHSQKHECLRVIHVVMRALQSAAGLLTARVADRPLAAASISVILARCMVAMPAVWLPRCRSCLRPGFASRGIWSQRATASLGCARRRAAAAATRRGRRHARMVCTLNITTRRNQLFDETSTVLE